MFDENTKLFGFDIYDASFLILLAAKAFGFLKHTWLFVLIPVFIKLFLRFGRSWLETAAEDILTAKRKRDYASAPAPEMHDNTEILDVVTEEMEKEYIEKKDTDQES